MGRAVNCEASLWPGHAGGREGRWEGRRAPEEMMGSAGFADQINLCSRQASALREYYVKFIL